MVRRFRAAALACVAFLLPGIAMAAGFTPGNVIVYRIGSGTGALSALGNPVFLDEYTPNGVLVQTVPMPTAASGGNKAHTASGTATTDGHMTRSADGSCLVVPGYGRDQAENISANGNIAGSGTLGNGQPIPRVVSVVSAAGAIDVTTALLDTSQGGNFRGAASVDCNSFWVSGASGGERYALKGATTSTDLSGGTFGNLRVSNIFDNQLYVSASVTNLRGVATVGTGLPTSGAQTLTKLPGLTDTNAANVYGFFLADLDPNVPGLDTLYVADESALGITKFSLVSGTWVANGSVGTDANDYRALTGTVSGNTVTLYATRVTNGGELVKLTDASGFNGAFAPTQSVIATVAANQAYRGVAMAPYLVVTPSAGPNGTISPATPQQVGGGTQPMFTVTPDPGYVALVGGTCGGNLVGTTYTTNAVTASCTVSATFTLQQTYTVTPSAGANGSINPNTPQTVLAGDTKQFTVTPNAGYVASVGGTCGGNLVGNTFTTNAVNGDCTVDATFTLVTYTVTPSAGANGSINPATAQTVAQGQTTQFTVTPDSGFSASVGGTCGGTLNGTTFTTNAITADCTVSATFAPLPTFTVTPSVIGGGAISPNTAQVITQGQTATFTVTPNGANKVAVRGTCGGTLTGNTYVTNPITANCTVVASFAAKLVLFVGNSYTFGRVDPVMSYNTANVTDLTYQMWLDNPTGSNADEPHPWGGIPGVFKKLTDQAGLDFDVSISARNAASLRGHYLNSNPAGWDLRGNVASQRWDVVVLQDLSDEPLPANRGANANLPYFNAYANKLQRWVHVGDAETYTESQLFGGSTAQCQQVTGASASACDTQRVISPANANANSQADVYLYQTWARPDMIGPNGTNANGLYYTAAEGLELMTSDLHDAYFGPAVSSLYKAVNPVGDAFLIAVQQGFALRDPYVPEAGKINLWHTDYFHPSKHGSYLSALVHFAMITSIDPTTLGRTEQAAADLGITQDEAEDLQLAAKLAVVPRAPLITSSAAGDGTANVVFAPPSSTGNLPVIDYTATCGSRSKTETAPPGNGIVVTGLTNGVQVSCTVVARNAVGTSSASNAVLVTPQPGDQDPDAFTFNDLDAVYPGTTVTSNAITVTGIASTAPISVTGGSYSIGCNGTFTAAAGSIALGNTVCVRHMSPQALSATTNTVLTIGTVSDTFSSTTVASLPPDGDDDGDGIPNGVEQTESRNPFVKDNDVFADPRLFAMQQYRDLLGREGEAAGIQYYVDQLNAGGATRIDILESFLLSGEFQDGLPTITRLYFSYFGRIPDYGGLQFQLSALRSGVPLADIAQAFYNSPEFTDTYGSLTNDQYINLVYQNVLGRAPDADGFTYYKTRLDSGELSKGQMMIGFSESEEHQNRTVNATRVVGVYVGLLRRSPEQSGLDFYVNLLQGGATLRDILPGFFDSAEYRGRFLP